jgi:hypothetical protein
MGSLALSVEGFSTRSKASGPTFAGVDLRS